MTVVSWLDWKLGARLLLKYPALTTAASRVEPRVLHDLAIWRRSLQTVGELGAATSVMTSVIMAAVGLLACAAPARRALRIQPTEALRQV